MKKQTLRHLREEIDAIDQELLDVLARRTELVRKIGAVKKMQEIQPLDKKRWKEVLDDKLVRAKELNLPQNMVKTIYNKIHKYSLEIEEKI